MVVRGAEQLDELTSSDLATLIPRLAYDLVAAGVDYKLIDGSLLSADISGFTRLTEELASRGREGAEIITSVVNSCFDDLVRAALDRGGDVIKFGGDAVLVLFTGPRHRARAGTAAIEMQVVLGRNPHARRNELRMTVGVSEGSFHAVLTGGATKDLLLAGPDTTETLRLEDVAEMGQVLTSTGIADAIGQSEHGGGLVLFELPIGQARAPLDVDHMSEFVAPSLHRRYRDYVEVGAEHRQAAVGFISIGGVDALIEAEGGPAAARALDEYLQQVRGAVAATDTSLLHSDMAMGGVKLLVAAGVPDAIENPADALLASALAIRSLDSPFDVRIGLNIGTCFAGFLGSPQRRTFTMMGDSINTAARMLGPCEPGEIVAVSDVARRARGEVVGDELGPVSVKGKTVPIQALRVENLGHAQARAEVRVEFQGRATELDQLMSSIRDSVGTEIVGPAGSGKSRLRDEALGRGVADPDQTLDGAGGRYLMANPYGAFWTALRRLLGIDVRASVEQAGAELVETLPGDLVDRAALVAPVANADVAESDVVQAIEPEFRRDALHAAVADLLGALGVRAIFLEDTQWLDDASTQLIEFLAQSAPDHGWVVVRSHRVGSTLHDTIEGELEQSDGDGSDSVRIALGPLADDALGAIIEAACPRRLLRHELESLIAQAQGNPLFALELAAVSGEAGAAVPESIEQVIASRLDRLSRGQRRTVRLASVLGARFARSTYQALVASGDHDVADTVDSVGDMFVIDDGEVAFREPLYRDVAYASISFAQRKRMHLMVGEYLESGDDTEAIAALLSEHFMAAGDRKRCWRYAIVAAERATEVYSPADAAVLYRRALDHAPRGVDKDDKSRAWEGLGHALVAAGSLEDAYDAFQRARSFASDPDRKTALQCRQADCRDRQGRFSDCLRIYTAVLRQVSDDGPLAAEAHVGRASVFYRRAAYRRCRDSAISASTLLKKLSQPSLEGRAWMLVSLAGEQLNMPGWTSEAELALQCFRDAGDRSGEAEVLNNIGASAQVAGNLADAASAYRSSVELKRLVGDQTGAALGQMNLAEVDLDRGVTTQVRRVLRDSLATFTRTGFTLGVAYTGGLLGRHALLTQRLDEAKELFEESSRLFGQLGAEGHSAEIDLYLVEVLALLRADDEVRRLVALGRERLDRGLFETPKTVAERLHTVEVSIGST